MFLCFFGPYSSTWTCRSLLKPVHLVDSYHHVSHLWYLDSLPGPPKQKTCLFISSFRLPTYWYLDPLLLGFQAVMLGTLGVQENPNSPCKYKAHLPTLGKLAANRCICTQARAQRVDVLLFDVFYVLWP